MTLSEACRKRDFSYVAGWVCGRFGVEVSEGDVKAWFASAPEDMGESAGRWTDGSWFMWFRNRLDERGEFMASAPSSADQMTFIATAVLHVGFIGIVETDEMLKRLHEPTFSKRQADIARSKLFSLNRDPQPIDKTALLVGGKTDL